MTGQTDSPTTLKAAASTSVDKQADDANDGDAADESNAAAAAAAQTTTTVDKYEQFKGDPEKMQQMKEFVNSLLESAEKEAELKLAQRKVRTN